MPLFEVADFSIKTQINSIYNADEELNIWPLAFGKRTKGSKCNITSVHHIALPQLWDDIQCSQRWYATFFICCMWTGMNQNHVFIHVCYFYHHSV